MKQLRELLFDLSMLHGISSREEDVIDYMRTAFLEIEEDVRVDTLGNVICRIASGKDNAKRLMVFAHTDELGLIVHRVEADGFLRFTRVGGVSVNVLPGTRVDVLGKKGPVRGIIGVKSHHVTSPEEKGKLPPLDKMYIDAGFASREAAEAAGVFTGSFCTFAAETPLMLNERTVSGKAMDDRACCAALIEYARGAKKLQQAGALNWDVYIVACVQEEFNVRGILPAVTAIKPDASIGLDIGVAADTPDDAGASDIRLGGGPGLTYMNFHGRGTLAGVLPDKKLIEQLEQVADDSGIAFQREVIIGVITENAFITFHDAGVPVANLSLPCRYTHTPIETIDLGDLDDIVQLLLAFTGSLEQDQAFGKNK